jgi:hypothetical protein
MQNNQTRRIKRTDGWGHPVGMQFQLSYDLWVSCLNIYVKNFGSLVVNLVFGLLMMFCYFGMLSCYS